MDLLQLLRAAAGRMAWAGRAGQTLFGRRVLALLLYGRRLLEGKVNAGCTLLAQSAHRQQQTVTVRRVEHSDGVQIGIADLFAYFQIVVPVVQEGIGVLAQVQGPEPLDNDVAAVLSGHRTVCCCWTNAVDEARMTVRCRLTRTAHDEKRTA